MRIRRTVRDLAVGYVAVSALLGTVVLGGVGWKMRRAMRPDRRGAPRPLAASDVVAWVWERYARGDLDTPTLEALVGPLVLLDERGAALARPVAVPSSWQAHPPARGRGSDRRRGRRARRSARGRQVLAHRTPAFRAARTIR